jgi:hypothetical protein
MDYNSMNSKVASPAPSVQIDNKISHISTSYVKLQQETIMTISSQSNFSSIFQSNGTYIDFLIPAHSAALSQLEKITLQMEITVNYPAASQTPKAYILPPTFTWLNRIEMFSDSQLYDTIRSDHLFYEKSFKHHEELSNDGKLELFDVDDYGLSPSYPALFVNQTGKNTSTAQTFRVYIDLPQTYLTCPGFFLPVIGEQQQLRFYFNSFDLIKPTFTGNQPVTMTLNNAQVICSGVKYSSEEEQYLIDNDYNGMYSVKCFTRRWNRSRLNFNAEKESNVDVSYLRGTFSTVGFWILPSSDPKGEQNIQYQLYQDPAGLNLGVNGLINSIQPVAYGSSLNYSLPDPINYLYTPETFQISSVDFLDSSSRPVYVSNQDGNILRNSIPTNHSQCDWLTNYSIYRFDFTNSSQEDYEVNSSRSGFRTIDGLYSLKVVSENDLSALSYVNASGTVNLKPILVGVGLQCSEVIINNGKLSIKRY